MLNKRRGHVPLGWSLLFLLVTSLASLSFPVHAAASADLTIDSIWLEDASQVGQPISQVSPGQSFNIVATIKNIGQDAASGYYLDVYYDSDYGRGGPDNIAAAEVQTWYVGPLTAQAGAHTTKWVVDPDNKIAELDETNNQKELAFTVGSQTTTTTVTSSSPSSTTQSTSTTTVTQTSSSTPSTTQLTSTSTTSSSPSSTTQSTSTATITQTSSSTSSTTQLTSTSTTSSSTSSATSTSTYSTSESTSTSTSVQDKTPPVVTVPSDMTKEAAGPTGVVVSYAATASDLVDGSITPICTPSSGSTFPLASTKVTCTATDKAGNTGSASFQVTVVDTTPPKLSIPLDMTVQASGTGAVVTFSASASDLVDGSIPITCTPASGSTFPLGTTTVTCSATDKTGNEASGSFKVTVTPSSSTVTVTVKLLDSSTNGLSGGMVQYYSGGWRSFGTTGSDGKVSMVLPPGTYNFQISWAGASQQKSQDVATNPTVVFQTTLATMKLLSSAGSELSGGAQYYAGGWKTFGGGKTTTTMELLPITYTFQISWAGASQKKSQNVATNPNVVFQTVQVHSDSGKCTSYYAGGWKTFTQDMQLLPGTYMFRFSDRTRNTSYTLVVGAVKHIH